MTTLYEGHWILTALVVLPLLGGVACLLAPEARAKMIALGTTLFLFALSLPLFWTFDTAEPGFQNQVSIPWVEAWGISYSVGVDGISILMILLTTFIMPLSVAGRSPISRGGSGPSTRCCSSSRRG
ncbi:hypothetical protein [Candidatus Palauibacter sp.]|uniref:hypothetical protein n=1 Tax=Candidatus Palauibacter sp. TaxID=3101350 RepID=UPI003B5BB569